MNKFVTFLLGMLFGIIFVFGALFGVGFYFYKNGNISMFTEEIEGLGKFNTMTVEEIINLVISMAEDSQTKGSLGYLKANYNLDISALLDPEGLKEGLFDYFNDLNIGYLMSGDVMGFLGTIKLGIGFAFAEGMVSQGGVSLLREKSLGDILGGEGNILSNLVEVFGGVRLGAFLGENYSETPNDDGAYEYEYIGEGEGGLFALLANCELSAVLKIISGQSDIFEEIKIGGLSELGELAFSDLLSSTDFGELLEGKTLGDLIEEEEGEYTLQFMSLFNGIYIGKLLGYTKTGDDWTKGEGEAVTGIELALARIDVGALLDDFSIDSVIDGLFLGDLMGYAKGALTTDSCPEGCIDHEEGEHIVKYVWTNDGNALSGIEAQLANFDLSDLLNDFSVDALLGDMLLGDIMGYEKDEQGAWTDKNGNLITGVEKALADCLMSDILEGFDIDNILGDVYLGDIMGFKQGELTAESCGEECVTEHEHIVKYQWTKPVDGKPDEEVKGIELALANTFMSDILEGFDVKNILGDVYLGEVMGYYLEGGVWYNNDTESKVPLTGIEKALADCPMIEILEGFNVSSILGEVYLGEVMGFKQGELTADSCGEECVTEHEHIVKYNWTKPIDGKPDEEVKGIELALANTFMSDILEGFDVKNILGDVFLGEVMGYTRIYTCGHEEEEHIHTDECSYIWEDSSGNEMKALELALADTLMSDILNGDFEFEGLIEEIYLGEIMGYTRDDEPIDGTKCPPDCDNDEEGHEHDYYKYKWYKDEGKEEVKGIEQALANTLMNSLLGGKLNINSIIGHLSLGEVMGYYLEDGVWYNKNAADKVSLTGIEKALAETEMNDILGGNFNVKSILGDVQLGEVMGYYLEGGVWYNNDTESKVPLTGIEKALADCPMENILEGFNVKSILGDVYLGEVMGYTRVYTCGHEEEEEHIHTDECSYIWKDPSNNEIKGIEKALANTLMSNILQGFDVKNILGDVYLGEVMGYSQDEGVWVDAGGVALKGIEKALAGTLMSDILEGFNVNDILGELYLGEVMGYSQDEHGVWVDAGGVPLKGIEKALAASQMSEILNGIDIIDILDGMFLGEVMGFTQGVLTGDSCGEECVTEHEHIVKYQWTKSVGGIDEEVKGIEFALANTLMSDVLGGDFNISKILGDMMLGEVMGYEKTLEGWKKGGADIKGIELRLADVEMSKLLDEGLDINDLLGDMYLGEVMNYNLVFLDAEGEGHTHSMESCPYVWQKEGADIKGIEGRLANVQMLTLLNGELDMDEVIGSMYIGELMGYTQGVLTGGTCDPDCHSEEIGHIHDYKEYEWWKDEAKTTPVEDKVTLILCNMVMTQILNGDVDLKDKVLALTLKDLLDVEGNTILELLADTPINDLGNSLNDLYIGELMGLTLAYTCATVHDHDIDLCDHLWLMEIEDISSYSDVAGEEGFVMSKGGDYIKIYEGLWYEAKLEGGIYIYKDVDSITKAMADTLVGGVGNISSRLTSAVSKASIGELIEMGVLNLSDNYDTLDYLFCQTHYDTEWEKSLAHSGGTCETLVDGSDRAAWWNLALPDFLNELISKMAP